MEDKENVLNTFSTDADNLGVVQAKYEVKTPLVMLELIESDFNFQIMITK